MQSNPSSVKKFSRLQAILLTNLSLLFIVISLAHPTILSYDFQYYLLLLTVAIIGIPFWTRLSKKTNKAIAWSISLLSSSIFFVFVIFLSPQDFILFIIISCLTGFCLGADLVLPPSIQADMTDMHKQKYKERI